MRKRDTLWLAVLVISAAGAGCMFMKYLSAAEAYRRERAVYEGLREQYDPAAGQHKDPTEEKFRELTVGGYFDPVTGRFYDPGERSIDADEGPGSAECAVVPEFVRRFLEEYDAGVGWIVLDGTEISYPFMQAEDNEYYLRRAPSGEYLRAGSLFLDCRCGRDMKDPNSIIYGHHMKDGSMFRGLDDYRSRDFFESHTSGILYLKDRALRLDIAACMNIGSTDRIIYDNRSDTARIMEYAGKHALCFRNTEVGPEDRILTLSTCSYSYAGERTVLIAVIREAAQTA